MIAYLPTVILYKYVVLALNDCDQDLRQMRERTETDFPWCGRISKLSITSGFREVWTSWWNRLELDSQFLSRSVITGARRPRYEVGSTGLAT
jgi:hypothetical protein